MCKVVITFYCSWSFGFNSSSEKFFFVNCVRSREFQSKNDPNLPIRRNNANATKIYISSIHTKNFLIYKPKDRKQIKEKRNRLISFINDLLTLKLDFTLYSNGTFISPLLSQTFLLQQSLACNLL